jgi:hypothetical protein
MSVGGYQVDFELGILNGSNVVGGAAIYPMESRDERGTRILFTGTVPYQVLTALRLISVSPMDG